MSFCSTPRQPADPRYVNGIQCTWHGPIADAGEKIHRADASSYGDTEPEFFEARFPCCPRCGGDLNETPDEDFFWAMIRNQERNCPGYEAMLRWCRGQCFPDFTTLQDAWRQAMEGQQ